MRISLFFCVWVHYNIIYSISTTNNMSISMKWSLVSHESLDPNFEKIEGFYKGDNFINDIAFKASLFVFCDLNTYLQF